MIAAWNSLWNFFNDTPSTACELTMSTLSLSVTFSVTCLTAASLITKSCQQRWPIHSGSIYKVVHQQIWCAVEHFSVHLVVVNSCLQQVKELLKSDSICQSYGQMKKGPVFLTHNVYYCRDLVNKYNNINMI